MNYRDIPAFCINLDTRADRWAAVAEQFLALGWPITRQPGVRHTQSPYPALRPAAAGCLDSHKAIWQKCLDEAWPIVAVFEDDVVFPARFKDIFAAASEQLPADWGVWLLHSFKSRNVPHSEYLVRLTNKAWGTHGYFATPRACAALLALPDSAPVDVRLTADLLARGISVFGSPLKHTLAFQRGDDSDIPETAQVAFWRHQRELFCR